MINVDLVGKDISQELKIARRMPGVKAIVSGLDSIQVYFDQDELPEYCQPIEDGGFSLESFSSIDNTHVESSQAEPNNSLSNEIYTFVEVALKQVSEDKKSLEKEIISLKNTVSFLKESLNKLEVYLEEKSNTPYIPTEPPKEEPESPKKKNWWKKILTK